MADNPRYNKRHTDEHLAELRSDVVRNLDALRLLSAEVKQINDDDTAAHQRIDEALQAQQLDLHGIGAAVNASKWWVATLLTVLGAVVTTYAYLSYDAFQYLVTTNDAQNRSIEHNARQTDENTHKLGAVNARVQRNERDIERVDTRVRELETKHKGQ